jgi:hypothetical protein
MERGRRLRLNAVANVDEYDELREHYQEAPIGCARVRGVFPNCPPLYPQIAAGRALSIPPQGKLSDTGTRLEIV